MYTMSRTGITFPNTKDKSEKGNDREVFKEQSVYDAAKSQVSAVFPGNRAAG